MNEEYIALISEYFTNYIISSVDEFLNLGKDHDFIWQKLFSTI